MLPHYHKLITTTALASLFSSTALKVVTRANLAQDHISGQIGHPEFHFDDSKFDLAYRYLDTLRNNALSSIIERQDYSSGQAFFGKLTHTVQDFYAHSTYISLLVEKYPEILQRLPNEDEILLQDIVNNPRLISGRMSSIFEMVTFLPFIGNYFVPLFPDDSHAKLNHDTPEADPLFPYVFQAAVLRTKFEYNQLLEQIPPDFRSGFTGKDMRS